MSTDTSKSEVQADLESVMAAAVAGRPVDPVVAARVHAGADKIRKRLTQTNIVVELIREARDDQ